MHFWIVPCVNAGVGLLAIAVSFYIRFLPDATGRKRNFKLFAVGVLNVAAIAYQVWNIDRLAHSKELVTPRFIAEVASYVIGLAFTLAGLSSLCALMLFDKFLNAYPGNGWRRSGVGVGRTSLST
jgi:hypothetical protein